MLASKDPKEGIVMTFDFSAIAATITSPEISIDVISGTDADVQDMRSGTPQILDGNKVLQRVINGVDGADYHLRCIAKSGTDNLVVPATLRVRSK